MQQELTGEVLKKTGVTVVLTSVTNMLAFFTAAIIPVPALRAFSLQVGLLLCLFVCYYSHCCFLNYFMVQVVQE